MIGCFIIANHGTLIIVNFNDIADAYILANMMGSPAELHGVLCGRICSGENLSEQDLMVSVTEFLNVEAERVEDLGDMLPALYQFSQQQICSGNFEFQPLLPDDDFDLSERLACLAEWCQGFLFGLGRSGLLVETELTGDIADVLTDLASISHVGGIDETESVGEEDEVSYTELVEYVRVAVLLIHAELSVAEVSVSGTIH